MILIQKEKENIKEISNNFSNKVFFFFFYLIIIPFTILYNVYIYINNIYILLIIFIFIFFSKIYQTFYEIKKKKKLIFFLYII